MSANYSLEEKSYTVVQKALINELFLCLTLFNVDNFMISINFFFLYFMYEKSLKALVPQRMVKCTNQPGRENFYVRIYYKYDVHIYV